MGRLSPVSSYTTQRVALDGFLESGVDRKGAVPD